MGLIMKNGIPYGGGSGGGSSECDYAIVQAYTDLPSTFGATDRKMYYVTSESCFYLWDGTTWVKKEVDLSIVKNMIAEEFDATKSYDEFEFVIYENELYVFNNPHTAGDPWDPSEVSTVSTGQFLSMIIRMLDQTLPGIEGIKDAIADDFKSTKAYSNGDFVWYNYELYRFNTDHTAGDPWNQSEVDSSNPICGFINGCIIAITSEQTQRQIADAELASDLADPFDISQAYAVGDIVSVSTKLYRFKVAHAAGDPINPSTDIEAVTVKELIATGTEELINLIYPVGSIYMSVNNTNPGILFGGTWEAWGTGKVPVGIDGNDTDFNTVEKTGGAKTESYTPAGSTAGVKLTAAQSGIPAHSHGLNSHTHTIPALSGATSTDGAHTHQTRAYANIENTGTLTGSSPYWWTIYGQILKESTSNGAHSHTVITTASTTGQAAGNTANNTAANASAAHNHAFTGTAATINHMQPYITCYMWKRTA